MSASNALLPSDSEDEDYVPPVGVDESSSGEELKATHIQESDTQSEEKQAAERQKRNELWESFKASVASTSSKEALPVNKIKIVKRYRFAGEDVSDVVEVPEDSTDAKKWPRWMSTDPSDSTNGSAASPSRDTVSNVTSLKTTLALNPSPAPTKERLTEQDSSTQQPKPRPGPRKGKSKFTSLEEPKAKKLTTLAKSAMDWRAHVDAGAADKGELEANRRGGGYLEKVEFLQRVDERRDEVFEANRPGKRRKL
ncbi:hypothetical protein FISHEDRAFT_78076 [Fistulina hepatica ATCC 64428]|nr:hypothetical protein FISHEDRAFT_78076 [Fistulina hepatica ATCC 64428]